jgi:hypothetical protein
MKRRVIVNQMQTAPPIWCEECRVRIAPYELTAIYEDRSFHKRCLERVRAKRSLTLKMQSSFLAAILLMCLAQ